MYAVKRPLPADLPPQSVRVAPQFPTGTPRPQRRVQRHPMPHRAIALETAVKLTVNLGLSAVAIAALGQLIPREFSQQAKLQELQVASKASNDRMRTVRNNFQHYFDPTQAPAIMADQTNRVHPREKTIVMQRSSAGSLSDQVNNLDDLAKQKVERSATGY